MIRSALCLGAVFFAGPALSADPRVATVDPPRAEVATVPGGDIFGFTSGTDIGSPGDAGVAFETTSRIGRRDGHYFGSTLKTQLSFTIAENLAVAVSPFVSAFRIRDVTGLEDRSRIGFDGVSGELSWRIVPRTAGGFAMTLSTEPRVALLDGASGARAEVIGNEFKVFMDWVLMPGRWYAAMNLNYALGGQRIVEPMAGDWTRSSSTNLSVAVAHQLSETLFIGLEARLLAAFDGLTLNRNLGNALFVGPNLLVRVNDKVALNVAWTPQVAGRSTATAATLDLDNFERHQLRLKAAISF